MADVSLVFDGLPAILLKPDTIYRIGRKKGLEISVADESMELAHATACILRRGVVRLAALVGRMFVNEQEKTLVDIGKEDALAGQVKLRFGNVQARLKIKEDNDEAHDSSGFGECLKNRSIDSTLDSLDIPETQPPSANTTVNTTADSFFIPETQAVVLDRPRTSGKVSLGDDFMIPETQDFLAELPPAHPIKPVLNPHNFTVGSDGESSQGSMIRMCTQDYNEDAIDDFDSSQVLCDALLPLPPPTKPMESLEKKENKRDQLDTTDFEMSALNWSASNSKCCALSSTKADAVLPPGDACITPELTAPSVDRNICTPDLFDLILGRDGRADSCSPDPFVRPADRGNATTPQFGGVKQLVVATIETPTATPDKENAERSQESNQDMIVTQRFPGNKLFESDGEDDELPNQDFVATQAFNLARPQPNEASGTLKENETNQDFIATQAFNFLRPKTNDSDKPSKAYENSNQDFIETQVFNLDRLLPSDSTEPTKDNETSNQDFIATQAFPAKINSSRCQDFIDTQPFHVVNQHSTSLSNKENIPHDVSAQKGSGPKTVEDSSDEIDAVLNEMVSGTVVTSPVNPNEETIKFFRPCVIKDKNHYQKICQIEGVFSDLSNKSRWRTDATGDGSRKRVAKSESPPATPSRKNRRISEGSQRLEINVRKRRANSADKNSEQHEIGSIAEEKTKDDEGEAPFKVVANQWQNRRNRINSRSDTPGNSLEKSKVITELEDKSKEEPPSKKKRDRKAKTAEKSKTDSPKDIPKPTTRSRRKTSDEDAGTEKQTKSKVAEVKTKRQATIKDAEVPVKTASGRKVKKADTPKDMPKSTIRTRRQTSEEDAGTTGGDKEIDVKDIPKDIPKPMARGRRKASEDDTETSKVENPVKLIKAKKPKSIETSKADASEDKPLPRTRRKTIVEEADTPKEEKPANISVKRAVVRISRTIVDQADTSSNSGNNIRVTRAANSRSATPSIEEPSSSSSAAKASNVAAASRAARPTRGVKSRSTTVDELPTTSVTAKEPVKIASREEPPSSSVNTKKGTITAEGEGVKNRSGATTTRFSQPDPDPLKAFNQYVRKAKATGKIKVAFTMCNRQALDSVLKSLKHVVETTEDPLQCDLLIMDKGERTYKFLAVIASNKPVLSSNWLYAVKKSRSLDIKADHLFSDAKFMETFRFKPLSVLEHPRLLFGLHFMLGEDIIPKAIEMKVIIQSAGGKVHVQPPSLAISMDLYVVTTSKDTKTKRRLSNHEKVHFVKTEAIMQALVQHNVELLDEYKLSL
ncbi:uncharacterized protein LOC119553294 isoform X2 [Drosophila subpulchrella]|uniref:uncharacterized protein LOC119553294 isoform X2 n=1 Tax=Drosophila subpulchrella TaxID=1486046 RepID=UPI0018A14F84|nr:uncharacterized protein LOC119553294 isoform X2 [Drosophila subpulchrella]